MIGWKILQMKVKEIEEYLDFFYKDARCELIFNMVSILLIATVLSAQSTDKMVNSVTEILFSKYDSLSSLANANVEDIKSIIKPIGTYNKKSEYIINIAKFLLKYCGGCVPRDRKILESMDGVGRKTANVVLSNLYDYPLIAVDTHVARVSKRVGLCNDDDDVLDIEKKLMKHFKKNVWSKRHHQMVLFGRYNCKAKKPLCNECKLYNICKYNK